MTNTGRANQQPNFGLRRHFPASFWPALVLLLSLPALTIFFRLGLPNGDDSILHFMKLVALDQQWRSGVVYARWVPELAFGLGYPLFNYYGLAPSYAAELLHMAGASFETALALEYTGLVLAAGLGMWRLAGDIFGALPTPRRRWAALAAGVAYVYAAYLLTNAYVRGAVGELAGQALLPWLLWSLRLIFYARRPQGWAVLAGLGIPVLAVTHSLMLLFSVPVLLGYSALLGWQNRQRAAAGLALAALVLGGLAALRPLPAPAPLQAPARPIVAAGVALLGVRTQVASARSVYVYPYWFVQGVSAAWQAHWRLLDGQGRLMAETNARPWFDTATSAQWPSGTVADDAYSLALPPGLPAGSYALEVCLHALEMVEIGCAPEQTYQAGTVNVPSKVPLAPPAAYGTALGASFGADVALVGYTLKQNGQPVTGAQRYRAARPGDVLEVTLYWQGLRALAQDYHGFINLVDEAGQPLTQQDSQLGTQFFPPRLWDAFYPQRQTYRVVIPAVQAGAVYWTTVGVYGRDGQRLPAHAAGADLGGAVRLEALKVVPPVVAHPEHTLSAHFDDMARLLGYDVSLPAAGLRAGSQMTLTLYYQADQGIPDDLTQFVHVYDAELGLVGQADTPPRHGLNPTSAWLPGEVIVDTVSVPIAATAAPGRYQVQVGFYDPAAGGARLPVMDSGGQRLSDDQLVVTDVIVRP